MPTVPISANTLGQMKTDISTELARGDTLDSIIPSKIAEAIEYWQPERFWFSESRDFMFSTAQGQEFYGETTAPIAATGMSTLQFIDYVVLYIGSVPWIIARRTDKDIEILNQNGLVQGQPWNWSYYNEQFRLGPIPDTAYPIRIAAHRYIDPPASDDETGNPWMTNAEKLIRCYAKFLIFAHNIRNTEQATAMMAETEDALSRLKARTNKLLGQGLVQPMEF